MASAQLHPDDVPAVNPVTCLADIAAVRLSITALRRVCEVPAWQVQLVANDCLVPGMLAIA